MASGPITSWQIEREKFKAVADFVFLGSKITADVDCSQTTMRYHFTPVRMAAIQKSTSNKSYRSAAAEQITGLKLGKKNNKAVSQQTGKFLKSWEYQTTLLVS